jgi:hypothetical protein
MQLVGALVPPSPPSRHPQRQLGCGSTRLLIQQAPTRDALTHRAAQTNANSERGDETRACKASKDIHTRTHNTRALARVPIESATIEHPIHRQRIATPPSLPIRQNGSRQDASDRATVAGRLTVSDWKSAISRCTKPQQTTAITGSGYDAACRGIA